MWLLSFFNKVVSYAKWLWNYFNKAYIFPELNEKSLVLARSIKLANKDAAIVFTSVSKGQDARSVEMVKQAKKMRAICFRSDILRVNFNKHSPNIEISFFTIGGVESENFDLTMKLVQLHKDRNNVFVFTASGDVEGEMLASSLEIGNVKIRRINEERSLINQILYEEGNRIFESAKQNSQGSKDISAVVVGMGKHGREMIKGLAWFGQMEGYRLEINAFDKDALAKDKFSALAPELISEKYNGVAIDGEAQYSIKIHSGIDVETETFAQTLQRIKNITYAFVALGDDWLNIVVAARLRMYFERMKCHPIIQVVVRDTQKRRMLKGFVNFQGQPYDIEGVGDLESFYTQGNLISSALEKDALQRHLKWGAEDDFWKYEYNYRSSIASAIHLRARRKCQIPGANKPEETLNDSERRAIETVEHKRWNAYMRAEGYSFSGSKDKSSRNDLAKMHHNLVDFSSLTDEEKRKDSRIGTLTEDEVNSLKDP